MTYRYIRDGWWIEDMEAPLWPRVPNGFGGFNSFRPADSTTSPEAVTVKETVRAGDDRLLARIKEYNAASDYGRAVKLARAVSAVNEKESGPSSPLRVQAQFLEARLHKRWAKFAEAARCWDAVAEANLDTPETREAVFELAGYYIHTVRDSNAARRICERAIDSMPVSADLLRIINRHVEATYKERRHADVVAETTHWLATLPPPEDDKASACELSELWLYKSHALMHLGQFSQAAAACHSLIEMHPYPDSQNVLRAKERLRSIPQLMAEQNQGGRP